MTAGYITPEARGDFFEHISAANVDLKAFTDSFYHKVTASHLDPVLDTLRWLKHESDVHFEITTLLIPTLNDSDEELKQQCGWILENLGPDVPLHFSAYRPEYKMTIPATPPSTLRRARRLAIDAGLRYVYTGNVHDTEGDTTRCHGCNAELIVRDWYDLHVYRLTEDGRCPDCNTKIPGRFEPKPGTWGRRRLPVIP